MVTPMTAEVGDRVEEHIAVDTVENTVAHTILLRKNLEI